VRTPPSLRTQLRSSRLTLRPPRTGDAERLQDALLANSAHLAPWQPAASGDPSARSTARVRAAIEEQRRAWREDRGYALLILAAGRDAPVIGKLELGGVQRGPFNNAYLGYWIAVAHQGQGLMTEAVGLALRFAFEDVGLHRVQAAVMPRNAASLRVLDKSGFRREGLAERYLEIAGRWEDHVLHAITREELAPAAPRSRRRLTLLGR